MNYIQLCTVPTPIHLGLVLSTLTYGGLDCSL